MLRSGAARAPLSHSTGRGFVPSVGRSLYDRLVEQLKLAGQPVPDEADQPNGDRSGATQPAPGLPATWDDIAVGHMVIAHEARSGPAGGRPSSSPGMATC